MSEWRQTGRRRLPLRLPENWFQRRFLRSTHCNTEAENNGVIQDAPYGSTHHQIHQNTNDKTDKTDNQTTDKTDKTDNQTTDKADFDKEDGRRSKSRHRRKCQQSWISQPRSDTDGGWSCCFNDVSDSRYTSKEFRSTFKCLSIT